MKHRECQIVVGELVPVSPGSPPLLISHRDPVDDDGVQASGGYNFARHWLASLVRKRHYESATVRPPDAPSGKSSTSIPRSILSLRIRS